MKLAVLGGGELGKLIAEHTSAIAVLEVVGFYDDYLSTSYSDSLPILGKIDDALSDFQKGRFDLIIVGVGYNHFDVREALYNKFKDIIPFATIVHPSAYVDPSCIIGEGVFILPGVILDLGVIVEDNVLINTGTIVAHHSRICKNSFLAPGVSVAGLVEIGSSSFVGIGAIIKDSIKIGSQCIIGAGSLVLKDTKNQSIYYGVPARQIIS
ncbi:acetyltransferase [Daejeonella lutea]|uniref:Sugar O-acyltransferase, sialic acid O-acetyltransferase NeuD family n=1 Tax=Daejeonella lutea TaxID=572036 RepID=A0A1T5FCB8_9SPHI|nr:acetyltransferase [Daejeonella lutea]SKB93811.1 sugar O-acyltransferase, sialic acid O-acetyltransferase NeuD family [Daejeonella lutea]